MKDFYDAFENIKTPLSENDIEKYVQWSKEFGEQGDNMPTISEIEKLVVKVRKSLVKYTF